MSDPATHLQESVCRVRLSHAQPNDTAHGAANRQRVATEDERDQLVGWPGRIDSKVLQTTPLVGHINSFRRRDAAAWNAFTESHPDQKKWFQPASDASGPSLQLWNRHVQEAFERKLYWLIALPSESFASALGYRLLVEPDQRDGALHRRFWPPIPARGGVDVRPAPIRVCAVVAWLVPERVVKDIRPAIQYPPAASRSLSIAGPPVASSAAASSKPSVPLHVGLPQDQATRSASITYRALHTLGQCHSDWPLGAVAELLDNSYDANATRVDISLQASSGSALPTCQLRILDNGCGRTKRDLFSMLGKVGWSSKEQAHSTLSTIGKFGQGFKTGVFRLAASVLVLTKVPASAIHKGALEVAGMKKPESRYTVGFLALPGDGCAVNTFDGSSEWNMPFEAQVLSFDPLARALIVEPADSAVTAASLVASREVVLRRSPCNSDTAIAAAFDSIQSDSGTLLILTRLRMYGDQLELALADEPVDIQVRSHGQPLPGREWFDAGGRVKMDYSLRAYARVLYRDPTRMDIYVQGLKVPTRRAEVMLRAVELPGDTQLNKYEQVESNYKLHLGHSQWDVKEKLSGVMLYHDNRLISSYVLHTHLQAPYIGVLSTEGIAGVDVRNEKQGYQSTKAFHDLMDWVRQQCTAFSEAVSAAERDAGYVVVLDDWIQCDRCDKWRQYPSSERHNLEPYLHGSTLPWTCELNGWNEEEASCDKPQQASYNQAAPAATSASPAVSVAPAAAAGSGVNPLLTPTKAPRLLAGCAAFPTPAGVETVPSACKESSGMDLDQPPPSSPVRQLSDVNPASLGGTGAAAFEPPILIDQEPADLSSFGSLTDELGSGACATVYRVPHPTSIGFLALKKFHVSAGTDEMTKLLRELRHQHMVHHPNIVAIQSWIDQPLCLVTEYVDGDNLDVIIHGSGFGKEKFHLPPLKKHALLLGIASGMVALHDAHIVHSDLKPANIVIQGVRVACHGVPAVMADSITAKICDFGLAAQVKFHGKTRQSKQGGDGTPMYMPPEHLRATLPQLGGSYSDSDEEECAPTPRTSQVRKALDVWGFGVIAAELLSMDRISVIVGKPQRVFSDTSGCMPDPTDKRIVGTDRRFQKAVMEHYPFMCDPDVVGMRPYLKLLAACFTREPERRPTFKEIFAQLRIIGHNPIALDPSLPSTTLYRVLRCGQRVSADGIRAVVSDSSVTPQQHVDKATHAARSHFLSCTKSFEWALWYWCQRTLFPHRAGGAAGDTAAAATTQSSHPFIIRIDLSPADYATTIDMSSPDPSKPFRVSERYGISAEEVLVPRHIPLAAITAVYDVNRAPEVSGQHALLDHCRKHCVSMAANGATSLKSFADWRESLLKSIRFRSGWRAGGTFVDNLQRNSDRLTVRAEWLEEKATKANTTAENTSEGVDEEMGGGDDGEADPDMKDDTEGDDDVKMSAAGDAPTHTAAAAPVPAASPQHRPVTTKKKRASRDAGSSKPAAKKQATAPSGNSSKPTQSPAAASASDEQTSDEIEPQL